MVALPVTVGGVRSILTGPKLNVGEAALVALSEQLAVNVIPFVVVSAVRVAAAVDVNESACVMTGVTPCGNPVINGDEFWGPLRLSLHVNVTVTFWFVQDPAV